jgi:hypothetical protein
MIAALLMLAQIVPVPAEPKPVATTIAAIRANPRKFDGQVVRLRGYVNQCQRNCSIEERAANAVGGPGERLAISADKKFDAIVRPLVPTYVEFDARVDASCIVSACTDGSEPLTIVSLRSVVSPEPPEIEK